MLMRLSMFAFLVFSLPLHGLAQIRVLGPDYLVKSLGSTNGRIQGSTATFGAPFYGDRVLGRLVWGESKGHHHCSADDYEVPALDVMSSSVSKAHDQARLINIVMVRRGECTFVTKAKVASEKGAHAVIIVDKEDSTLTSRDVQNLIVADDGFGQAVSIPSVLISQYDGEPLIAAAKNEDVIVELAWDIPTDNVVALDLWMNSAASDTQHFLQKFTRSRKTLNEVVKFTPHYDVFSADPAMNGYSGLCYDSSARYCAADPDGAGPVSGKDVLEENVRQLCIHEMTRIPRSRFQPEDSHGQVVFYAEKWWNYVEKLPIRCPIDSADQASRFGTVCSEKLMEEVGIDVQGVRHCVQTTTQAKLSHELVNKAWSPRALRVNGWRYKGMVDADLVTRAVCSGFVSRPGECNDLLKPRDPAAKFVGGDSSNGISMGVLVTSAVSLIVFALCSLVLYRRCLEKTLRSQMRESVMLEVSDQMAQYTRVGDAI
jgi:hypothetical protein